MNTNSRKLARLLAPAANVTSLYPTDLLPGDVLLYRSSDIVGKIIAIKTGQDFSHVEVYVGNGNCLGARISGVNWYQVRLDKYLVEVRRFQPESGQLFNIMAAANAIAPMIGKGYDVGGLFTFFNPWAKHLQTIRVCSPVSAHFMRGGGYEPFNPELEDDDITPASFHDTPALKTIWRAGEFVVKEPTVR